MRLQVDTPLASTAVVPEGKHYAVFHNVLLQEQGILFYLPDELANGTTDGLHRPPDLRDMLAWQGWWPHPEQWKVHNSRYLLFTVFTAVLVSQSILRSV